MVGGGVAGGAGAFGHHVGLVADAEGNQRWRLVATAELQQQLQLQGLKRVVGKSEGGVAPMPAGRSTQPIRTRPHGRVVRALVLHTALAPVTVSSDPTAGRVRPCRPLRDAAVSINSTAEKNQRLCGDRTARFTKRKNAFGVMEWGACVLLSLWGAVSWVWRGWELTFSF